MTDRREASRRMTTTFRPTEATWPRPGEYRRVVHEIDDDGRVTPSVQCPQCDYHETGVVPEGWADA